MRIDKTSWVVAFIKGVLLLALPFCLLVYDRLARPAGPSALQVALGGAGYQGSVRWYIADLKPSFPEHKQYSAATALTAANYRAVLDGLKNNARVNGVRLPIIPRYEDAASYPALYRDVAAYARSLGLAIYASPMSVGMGEYRGWSDQRYAAWLANYVSAYSPEFLSPFNEPGLSDARAEAIVADVRAQVAGRTLLLGPDRQHVQRTIQDLSADPALANAFDIVDSHNANRDRTATAQNWSRLVQLFGGQKPVWASENPGTWGERSAAHLPGIDEAVEGGVQGVVVWMAKPSLVNDAGAATPKAREIAAHLAGGP